MLPAVLAFNAPAVGEQYAELAAMLPGAQATAAGLIDWCQTLIVDSGLPVSLVDANVPEADLPMLAADAMLQQRLLVNNPLPVDEQTALKLYRQAWMGYR